MSDDRGYEATPIELLTLQEALRRRPITHLAEVVRPPFGAAALIEAAMSWAIEEALHGAASELRVTLHDDGSAAVADDGAELSAATAAALMTRMTVRRRTAAVVGTSWSHLGPAVANALSAWCVIEGGCDGRRWRRRYEAGVATSPFSRGAAGRGTTIRCAPDPTLLPAAIDIAELRARLGRVAALVPAARVRLLDARGPRPRELAVTTTG